jgi:hypothetical protein
MMLSPNRQSASQETATVTLRIVRTLTFAVAALAVVGFVSYTIEHQPLINALAQ